MLGDGIGPDVVGCATQLVSRAAEQQGVVLELEVLPCGLSALELHGSTLPRSTIECLEHCHGWMLGPISHHLYPPGDARYIDPSRYLRTTYQLYANVRPCRSLPGIPAIHDDVDLVIVRENTEGFYADRNLLDGNGEFRPNADLVLSMRVISRAGCRRIARTAFALARARGKQRLVTAVHKVSAFPRGDGLFLECCHEVAADYPDVTFTDQQVDALAMHLVLNPSAFDVVVATNMFGDILSDEAAGLVGGLGLAPGLNVGDDRAMAQAVHGSAPDIADRGIANPVAEILSGAMLLDWLADKQGLPALRKSAADLREAVAMTIGSGRSRTPDMGGDATTAQIGAAILRGLNSVRRL